MNAGSRRMQWFTISNDFCTINDDKSSVAKSDEVSHGVRTLIYGNVYNIILEKH